MTMHATYAGYGDTGAVIYDFASRGPLEPLNGKAWHRPVVAELPPAEAEDARRRLLTPEERDEQAEHVRRPSGPGVGHNSGKTPSWATPSKLSLDEAAQANIGTGRYMRRGCAVALRPKLNWNSSG